MFKKDEELSSKNAETIIGQSIKVKGNFHGKGDIVVEGSLEGSIKTENNLFVGKSANITANIVAKNAKISGSIFGNIDVQDSLEIYGSAIIEGDIKCKKIYIEQGAVFNGKCETTHNLQKSAEKKD